MIKLLQLFLCNTLLLIYQEFLDIHQHFLHSFMISRVVKFFKSIRLVEVFKQFENDDEVIRWKLIDRALLKNCSRHVKEDIDMLHQLRPYRLVIS